MHIMDMIQRIIRGKNSKNLAVERLRRVLVHDRAEASPSLLHLIKDDLHAVVSKYMDADRKLSTVMLHRGDGTATLQATFHVTSLKRGRVDV